MPLLLSIGLIVAAACSVEWRYEEIATWLTFDVQS